MRGLHYLKTTPALRFDPARVIDDAVGQHSSALPEPLADQSGILFEPFDDHEKHMPEVYTRFSAAQSILGWPDCRLPTSKCILRRRKGWAYVKGNSWPYYLITGRTSLPA